MTAATARAVKLAYTAFQSTSKITHGPPIVLVHGMFGNQRNFEPIAKNLNSQGRNVITADMRNHGVSPHSRRMDYFAMSEDLSELLKEEEAEGGVVLGHSMGGKAAMVLALTQPDKVSKLIIEDVAPTSHSSSIGPVFQPLISAMRAIDFSQASSLSRARSIARQQVFKIVQDRPICDFLVTNIVKKDDSFKWRVNLDAMQRHLADLISFPHLNSSYTGKTLFIKGGNSNLISEADLPEIKRLFPNSYVETVTQAGHLVHAEKPQQFFDIVTKFLDES